MGMGNSRNSGYISTFTVKENQEELEHEQRKQEEYCACICSRVVVTALSPSSVMTFSTAMSQAKSQYAWCRVGSIYMWRNTQCNNVVEFQAMKKALIYKAFCGSPNWTWTSDPLINLVNIALFKLALITHQQIYTEWLFSAWFSRFHGFCHRWWSCQSDGSEAPCRVHRPACTGQEDR